LIADKNIRYQQNLADRSIAIVELPTNRWPIIEKIALNISTAVDNSTPGSYSIIGIPAEE
jgi:hypothetical protein